MFTGIEKYLTDKTGNYNIAKLGSSNSIKRFSIIESKVLEKVSS